MNRRKVVKPQTAPSKGHRGIWIPLWAIPIVWTMLVLVIQILLPWAISKLGHQYGWHQSAPAAWNLIGLIAVVIGLTTYIWCLAFHFKSYRESVRIGFSPPHLVVDGPYRYSRNPMYVSGLFVWCGWTIFYGNETVLIGLVLLWSAFTFRVIPSEERQLEELFGDEYRAYKKLVGRWCGYI